ncbi:MAG: tetratricopeptide repeat protein [Planctomycetes bacterium]|nr:tetratricopeptide repeat protein [Planctomycetota bacterium]
MDETPITASDHYYKGVEHQEAGDYGMALLHFDTALDLNYFGADICARKAETLYRLTRFPEAIEWFKRALRIDPDDAELVTWKGRVLAQTGNQRMAMYNFNRAIELDDARPWPWFHKGKALFAEQRFAEAHDCLAAAVARDGELAPEHRAEFLFWQAKALDRLDRPQEALAALTDLLTYAPDHPGAPAVAGALHRRLGEIPEAERCLRRAVERDRADGAALRELGLVLAARDDHLEAIKYLTAAVKLARDGREKGQLLMLRAASHERLGKAVKALADYGEVVAADPGAVEAHMRRAGIHGRLERYQEALEAVEAFGDAAGRDRRYVEGRCELLGEYGLSLGEQGDYAGAVACFREVLRLGPDLLDFPGAVARASLDESWAVRWREALEALLALSPRDGAVMACAALVALHQGDVKRARVLFKQHARLGEEVFFSLHQIGRIHHQRGALDRALHYYRESIRARPDFQAAHWDRADILERLDPASRELSDSYRAILALDPDNAVALERLARAFDRAGDLHRALVCAKTIAEKRRENPHLSRQIADLSLRMGRHEAAVDYARRACALLPGKPEFHVELGRAYLALALAREALAAFQTGRSLLFDRQAALFPEVLAGEAQALLLAGRLDDAAARAEEALVVRPDLAAARLVQATIHFSRGELDPALEACERLALLPRDPAVARAGQWLEARILFRKKEPLRAQETLAALLEKDPWHKEALALRWWIALSLGEAQRADEEERAAAFADHMRRGLDFLSRDEWAEALAAFEEAARGCPRRGEAFLHAAACLVQLERHGDALDAIQKAVRADPSLAPRVREHWWFEPLADHQRFVRLTTP